MKRAALSTPPVNDKPVRRRTWAIHNREPLVSIWTGVEIRALRLARRMDVRDFARHLGVGVPLVSKWENNRAGHEPRTMHQAALDTSLSMADSAVRRRFVLIMERRHGAAAGTDHSAAPAPDVTGPAAEPGPAPAPHVHEGPMECLDAAGPGVPSNTRDNPAGRSSASGLADLMAEHGSRNWWVNTPRGDRPGLIWTGRWPIPTWTGRCSTATSAPCSGSFNATACRNEESRP